MERDDLDKIAIIETNNDIFSDDTNRTIEQVVDAETGEIIIADEFFDRSEKIIVDARNVLQLAHKSGIQKYKCVFCEQDVLISKRHLSERNKTIYFFSHYKDSEDCPIKTGVNKSIQNVLLDRMIQFSESLLHHNLKMFIADKLSTPSSILKGFSDTVVSQTFKDTSIVEGWRKPDVYTKYNNIQIVFELNLFTTFLSVIVERDSFYRMHGAYIIWVLNSFEPQDEKVVEKDIYYAHKRNVFVLDDEAQKRSEDKNELVLHCYWQIPKVVEDKVYIEWHHKFITIDEITFHCYNDKFEAYYFDSDELFYNNSSSEIQAVIDHWESEKEKRWDKIFENIERKRIARLNWENNREERKARIQMQLNLQNELIKIQNGEIELIPFISDDLWGFKTINEIEVIKPKYSKVKPFINGIAWVKISTWGAIDFTGKKVHAFEYNDLKDFIAGKAVASKYCVDKSDRKKSRNKWGYIDIYGNVLIPFEYDVIEDFIDGIAKAKLNGHWGYLDIQGKTIIPFEYDIIEDFVDGIAKAMKYYSWGYIDTIGNSPIKDSIELEKGLIKGHKFGKWGVETADGEIIVPFKYDIIEEFVDGRAKAMLNGRWGYINIHGDMLIPFYYDEIGEFVDGRAKAKLNGRWGYINIHGDMLIPFYYDEIGEFVDGRAKAKLNDSWKAYDKWGYIGIQGNTLIPFEYEEIGEFVDGRAKAMLNGRWGYIGIQGNTLIPFEYEEIGEFVDGRAKAMLNGRWGYTDTEGNKIIEDSEVLNDDLVKGRKFEKCGVERTNGEVLIPFEYDVIEDFIDGRAKAKLNGSWGYIDIQGNIIIPFDYGEIGEFVDGRAKAKLKGRWVVYNRRVVYNKWGYIDIQGNIIIPFAYDEIGEFVDGRAKAKLKGRWGYIDIQGNIIISFDYDEIEDFIDGRAKTLNGRWGYIDIQGNTIIPFAYDKIGEFVDGRAKAKHNGRWGYIDIQGNTIISFAYDEIEDFIDGRAKAKLNGRWGYIDPEGNSLIEDSIELKKGLIKGRKFGKWGVETANSEIKVPFEYDMIACIKGSVIAFKDHAFRSIPLDVDAEEIELSVASIADFGVFIRLCYSFDGLLHISSIKKAGKAISDFKVRDRVKVYIDSVNIDLKRVSLTLLPPKSNKPVKVIDKINLDSYLVGDTYDGTITNIKPFGLFVMLQSNLTALLHINELKKHHKDISSFSLNDQINVKILTVDKEKERIALTL